MSRKITHDPQTFPFGMFDTHDVQEADLGARAVGNNGEVFRYVKANTDVQPGKVHEGPAITSDHENIAVASSAAVGDTEITVTLGLLAVTADEYAGGIVVINDVDGEGYSYRIDSHPAVSGGNDLTLTLEDPVQSALTTSSEATLVANTYNGVGEAIAGFANKSVGIGLYSIPANTYGWIQTRGPVSCLNDGGSSSGDSLTRSGSVSGAVKTATAGDVIIATDISPSGGVDTEYRPIYAQFE